MTYRRDLREIALDNYGFVTVSQAEEAGVPDFMLRQIAARGGLVHLARGLYRLPDNEIRATALDSYAEAVLRVGPDAYLTHDAVLAFHGLALVNPRRIRVGTPHRVRAKLPPTIRLVQRPPLPADALTEYEGIPSTTVAQALTDCARDGLVMPERLAGARREARSRGLISERESRSLAAAAAAASAAATTMAVSE